MWRIALIALALLAIGVIAVAYRSYRHAKNEAEGAMAAIAARAQPSLGTFERSMVADLPEVAQRYFTNAIEPGSPLLTTVQLRMQGKLLLGDRESYQTYTMVARQILAPPSEFVWMTTMRSGVTRVSGSDGLVQGNGWTRFWMNGLVPVVNERGSPDLNRSALTRAAMEAIWAPASLLPINGVTWEQRGPDTARIKFTTGIEPMDMTLGADGQVVEVVAMRWSNANPDKVFRLQPFGGTVEAEASFQGFTIPSRVRIGNHFGTNRYLPFFQVDFVQAEYF